MVQDITDGDSTILRIRRNRLVTGKLEEPISPHSDRVLVDFEYYGPREIEHPFEALSFDGFSHRFSYYPPLDVLHFLLRESLKLGKPIYPSLSDFRTPVVFLNTVSAGHQARAGEIMGYHGGLLFPSVDDEYLWGKLEWDVSPDTERVNVDFGQPYGKIMIRDPIRLMYFKYFEHQLYDVKLR